MTRKQKDAIEISNWNFVFPNQTNPYGTMFGGELLAIMDSTAAMAAIKYAETTVSTAAVESVKFKQPIVVGDRIRTVARVVLVGTTSLMVRTDVYKDADDGEVFCVTAHFTMVAFDDNREPTPVPLLNVEPDYQSCYDQALAIKEHAMRREKRIRDLLADD